MGVDVWPGAMWVTLCVRSVRALVPLHHPVHAICLFTWTALFEVPALCCGILRSI